MKTFYKNIISSFCITLLFVSFVFVASLCCAFILGIFYNYDIYSSIQNIFIFLMLFLIFVTIDTLNKTNNKNIGIFFGSIIIILSNIFSWIFINIISITSYTYFPFFDKLTIIISLSFTEMILTYFIYLLKIY